MITSSSISLVLFIFVHAAGAAPTTHLSNFTNSINATLQDQIVSQYTLVAALDGKISRWVGAPNIRGTWDIVWTCFATIFVCTYTLLCLNLPAPSDSTLVLVRRRVLWMVLAIIGPEIVLSYAAGQWSRAKQAVKSFTTSGHKTFNMRLAFFADMGGFMLHPKGHTTFDPFPLNAKQLHWLVIHGHVDYPDVDHLKEIWDKSKQDQLAKIITAFQIGYFVLQCIGRATQRLTITTLELNTLAIVVCSLMTSFTWQHKPSNVHTPIPLYTRATIEVLNGSKPWRNTPLDFIDVNGPGWSMNVQPFMNMPVIPAQRPIQRIPNDRFPMNPYGVQEYCVCFATLLFTGIHVAGCGFSFPTITEKIMWQTASWLLFAVTGIFWIFETMASWTRLGRWKWLYLWVTDRKKLPDFEAIKREEQQKREASYEWTELPLPWEFWTIMPVAIVYGIARMYLIVEAFLEFRKVDAAAFLEVNWANFIPHI
ncbi:hypothetical protein CFAM422_002399 [Trichoderma lentiforme]|uniref:Wax synthase domain-containing protein n=1 Tax=Trichoderma lentiforme TaxID=1567552 RepID=A0A9P5CFL3_9HYPO|nr:hypothetical protein CFAM422_002399 [Trichoderma lentiforme]